MRVFTALIERERARVAPQLAMDVQPQRGRLNEGFIQIDGIVDQRRHGQVVAVPRDEFRHRVRIAGLGTAPLQIAVFQVRGRHGQSSAHPFSSRKTGPRMGCPGWRMPSAVQVDRPAHGTQILDVIGRQIACERVDFLGDPHASGAAPLMRRRVRPALKLRDSPDRLGRRFGPHAPGVVERNPEVVPQRRLSGIFVIESGPLPRKIRLAKGVHADQHRQTQ